MSNNLMISVVMATYNRAGTIPLTLRHLAEQTLDPSKFEVIVVDDGSPDNTGEVVRNLSGSLPYRLTYLRHENHGPGYTQNRGILISRAPIVSLIADDILLSPRALESFLEVHRKHPEENVAVLGRVLQSPLLGRESLFLRKWDPFKFKQLASLSELPYYYFWACNISCKRDFLLRHELYREQKGRAGAAAHEDVELGYRLWRQGSLRIFYSEEALGHHYHIETLEGAIRRAYQRGLNWKEFRTLVDDPAITVHYHIFSHRVLHDYLATFKGRNNLMGVDRNPFLLGIRLLLRALVFNRLTTSLFWLPLLNLAEQHPELAWCGHTQIYRGAISYHFFRGVSDGEHA